VTEKNFQVQKTGVRNGEKIFMMHCQKCHPGGEAGLGPAINSNPAPQFIKRFQMRHGLGAMPSFKQDEISKNDLRDISRYLKAWKNY
jgi:mono/diheme cytochrome c family protein